MIWSAVFLMLLTGVGDPAGQSADAAIRGRSAPVNSTQWDAKNIASQATATKHLHAIDPGASAYHKLSYTQNFRIQNLDATDAICIEIIARTFAQSCDVACDAVADGTYTCAATAAATVGAYVKPGGTYTIAIDGQSCLCSEASANSPVANVEQTNRLSQ